VVLTTRPNLVSTPVWIRGTTSEDLQMNLLNLKRAAAISATALGMLAVPAAAASAAPASDIETLPAAGGACVAYATHDAPPMQCFDTFAAALDKASGGRLTDGPKNAQGAIDDPAFNAKVDASNAAADAVRMSAVAGGTVISIEYRGLNYVDADPLIWVGNSGNCSTSTNNTDYEVSTMPAGFVNTISSYRTYANCYTKHWENPNFGGASVGYNGSRSNIGAAMDNRTSSEQWS
jgi:hypothetical protein